METQITNYGFRREHRRAGRTFSLTSVRYSDDAGGVGGGRKRCLCPRLGQQAAERNAFARLHLSNYTHVYWEKLRTLNKKRVLFVVHNNNGRK